MKTLLFLLFLPSLLLTGCSTPSGPNTPMPPEMPDRPVVSTPVPVIPEVTPTPVPKEPDDYKLKVENGFTSFSELAKRKIDQKLTVTVITDPAKVEYARTEELMIRVSELGYRVNYEPAK